MSGWEGGPQRRDPPNEKRAGPALLPPAAALGPAEAGFAVAAPGDALGQPPPPQGRPEEEGAAAG